MISIFFLLLSLFLQSSIAAPQPVAGTTPTPTTSTGPAGPSVSSCGGPQRYELSAYFSNHTHLGHVFAVLADSNEFFASVAPHDPHDGQQYFGDWSFSAAPEDHNNVYFYIPPNTPNIIYDTYYLVLYGELNSTTLHIQSKGEFSPNFTHIFHVTEDPKTHDLSFTIPQYHKPHTFAVAPYMENGEPVDTLDYYESDKVPPGNPTIYLKAVKSC